METPKPRRARALHTHIWQRSGRGAYSGGISSGTQRGTGPPSPEAPGGPFLANFGQAYQPGFSTLSSPSGPGVPACAGSGHPSLAAAGREHRLPSSPAGFWVQGGSGARGGLGAVVRFAALSTGMHCAPALGLAGAGTRAARTPLAALIAASATPCELGMGVGSEPERVLVSETERQREIERASERERSRAEPASPSSARGRTNARGCAGACKPAQRGASEPTQVVMVLLALFFPLFPFAFWKSVPLPLGTRLMLPGGL